jgi:chaperonin GroEL
VALVRAIKAAKEAKAKGDEKIGVEIVVRALEAPIRQIAANCGVDGAVVADEVKQQKSDTVGFDANTGEYVDMYKAGIIDPAKVVKTALRNAGSIAGLMLTTQVLITRTEEPGGAKKPSVEGSVRFPNFPFGNAVPAMLSFRGHAMANSSRGSL